MTISFDSATNGLSLYSSSFSCDGLFVFNGSAHTTCSWTDSTTVRASFGIILSSVTYIEPGDTVTLKGGILTAACTASSSSDCTGYPTAARQSLIAASPSNPVRPSVIMIAPSQLSACTNLSIDASSSSGDGGRSWSNISWSVSSAYPTRSSSVSAMLGVLNGVSSLAAPIEISNSWLMESTYTITLSLTNFLGQSSSSTIVVEVTGFANTPQVSILGSYAKVTTASSSLLIESIAKVSACATTQQLDYAWGIVSSDTGAAYNLTKTNSDPRRFLIPKYALPVGSTYIFTVTVTAGGSSSYAASSSASTLVYITHGAVVAIVDGGSTRSFSINKNRFLDASLSYDEDVNPSSTAGSTLQFTWSCKIGSLANYGSDCSSLFISSSLNSSILTIPRDTLSVNTTYLFSVNVASSDGRSDSKTVSIVAYQSIDSTASISSSVTKFNVDSKLTLTSTIYATNSSATARWSLYSSGLSVSLQGALTPLTRTFPASVASSISLPLLGTS